jgi:hypothetical protein
MTFSELVECYEGYRLRQIDIDEQNYLMGIYFKYAYLSSKTKKAKYPKKPFLTPTKKEEVKNYTLEELKQDDDRFEELMKKRGIKIK